MVLILHRACFFSRNPCDFIMSSDIYVKKKTGFIARTSVTPEAEYACKKLKRIIAVLRFTGRIPL